MTRDYVKKKKHQVTLAAEWKMFSLNCLCPLPQPTTKFPEGSEGSAHSSETASETPKKSLSGPWDYALLCGLGSCVQRTRSLLPDDDDGLPPLLITTGEEDGGGKDS